jgi:hypothetical protein
MGVSHLKAGAKMAAAQASGGSTGKSPESRQVWAGPKFAKPASNSGTPSVPQVSGVNSFESKSVRPGNTAAQPPKGANNGGRAGAKSGQPHLGYKTGNHKGMPGGTMG